MADGKWTMTEDDATRVDLSFEESNRGNIRSLPNYGKEIAVDNRAGDAKVICAFCGSDQLQSGFGGIGEGFGYKSYKCRACGGTSNFVYKDDQGKLI